MLLSLLLLVVASAHASDPWGRPAHARVVSAPPAAWAARGADRRAHRLFWDEEGVDVDIERWHRGRWVVESRAAASGHTTRPLPVGTAFRLRAQGAARWSPALVAPDVVGPAALARMAAGHDVVLADTVGQVAPTPDAGGAWIATLGGGAARLDLGLRVAATLTTWEGLPSDRVVAVHAGGGQALFGTVSGAALVEEGRVTRIFDASLPDPYVQAVRIDGPRLWLGTYHGLARVTDRTVERILGPWSVFSIVPAAEGGVWVGYEGVRRVSSDAPPSDAAEVAPPEPGWLVDDRVFGVLDTGGPVLAAGRDAGVRQLLPDGADGPVRGLPVAGAFDVGVGPGGPWVAAGALGLVGPAGEVWGAATGLPGDAAYSVQGDGAGALWVGTERGVARVFLAEAGGPVAPPRAVQVAETTPWPADAAARDLLARPGGAWVAGPDGVRQVGRPHPHAGDLVVGAGPGVVALVDDGDGVWAIGRRAVRLDADGRLHHVPLPFPVSDAAWAEGALWAGGPDGVYRYEPALDRFRLSDALPEVTRVRAGAAGPWVVSRGAVFHLTDGVVRPYLQTRVALDLAPTPAGLWVGTERGLERIAWSGEAPGESEDVLGTVDDGVAVPAVAADEAGGCWYAAADGTVGRVSADGRAVSIRLPGPDPARPTRLVPDGPDAAFLLTEAGTWRIGLPAP